MSTSINSQRRQLLMSSAAAAISLVTAVPSIAQGSSGVLRVFVGSSPGSVPDVIARQFADRISDAGAGVVLVENRTGAAGQIAISALLSAGDDGSTLLLAPGGIATMYPAIYPRLAYDPARDLQAVAPAAELSLALGLGKAVPASVTTLADFVAWAHANPRKVNIGSPGIGTPPHVLASLFATRAGITALQVPYRGGPPAMNDLLGGELSAVVLPEGLLQRHQATGAVRMVATSGTERSRFSPDTPTFAEQGLPDVVLHEWFGFFAVAGVARERVAELAGVIGRTAHRADVEKAFAELSMTPSRTGTVQMAHRITSESRHWTPIIRAAGISVLS